MSDHKQTSKQQHNADIQKGKKWDFFAIFHSDDANTKCQKPSQAE